MTIEHRWRNSLSRRDALASLAAMLAGSPLLQAQLGPHGILPHAERDRQDTGENEFRMRGTRMIHLSEVGLAVAVVLVLFTGSAFAQDRMPPIPADKMTEAQKQAAAQFKANRGQDVFGPFVPLLRSPEVMLRTMALGDYLRYKTTLGNQLNEFVILITARHYTQHYEWSVHYPIAVQAGLKADMVKAIAEGRRPAGMSPDQEIAYDFTSELLQNHGVSDQTYARAVARFGEQGTIEMVGVSAYYTYQSMVLNTARTPVTTPAAVALKPLP